MAGALMIQGTGSHVGKSLLVAGLGRAFSRRGLRVRPFKPQNMSNNAAVTEERGEIGRAQALQARACGVAPTADMNPVLLKPQTDVGAQVIVQGRMWGTVRAGEYQRLKGMLMPKVLESFERLGRDADLVLVEGAGSPAEVNLRAGDIANMGFATETATRVVLVGDVDRGGVIASLCGTVDLLPPSERALIAGYLVNKFRGDPRLFDDALRIIGERTGLPSLGLVPWLDAASRLPAEDALGIEAGPAPAEGGVKVAVPVVSRMANFDDLDPLAAEPGVTLELVPPGRALPGDADLVILAGSKATRADLELLLGQGWDVDLRAHLRRGGWALGLCAGFQMLGEVVDDPAGIEGTPGRTRGLGLLEVRTVLEGEKRLERVAGRERASGEPVHGYEMHVGDTHGPGLAEPMLELGGIPHGAVSADRRIMGCYLHGLFAADGFRRAFLARLGRRRVEGPAWEQVVEGALNALADHLEQHVDLEVLAAAAGTQTTTAAASATASRQAALR